MKTINVNISGKTVTISNQTCSFYEAGLYVNDDNQKDESGNYPLVTDRDEIEEYFNDKYDEDIEVLFDDEQISIFDRFPELKEQLETKVFDALMAGQINNQKNYNTDLIIWKDGHITQHDYFGSCIHTAKEIETVLTVSQANKSRWWELWQDCMTEEQREYCEKMGWDCCWESKSENPEDWKEYNITLSDLTENNSTVTDFIESYEREL
jgi:hypothetical protein